MDNPEPVFTARGVRLAQPPRFMKEKHAKFKVGMAETSEAKSGWRRSITYDAMGWRMGERVMQEQLLPGDLLDIAFTIGHNQHPQFGGLELTLCDFNRAPVPVMAPVRVAATSDGV
jgi:single-stranded-DNA-specific exonuclease